MNWYRTLVVAIPLAGFGVGWSGQAQAVGCLSGGLAGAVAGHMVHHGVLGALGGCMAGHALNKRQQRAADQERYDNSGNGYNNGYNRAPSGTGSTYR